MSAEARLKSVRGSTPRLQNNTELHGTKIANYRLRVIAQCGQSLTINLSGFSVTEKVKLRGHGDDVPLGREIREHFPPVWQSGDGR